MAEHSLKQLLAKAKKKPGRLYSLRRSGSGENGTELKILAEATVYAGGIVLYAISPVFRRKTLTWRNDYVWRILDEELSKRDLGQISHLFAFTPEEFKPAIRKAVAVH